MNLAFKKVQMVGKFIKMPVSAKELLEPFQNRSNNQDAATNNMCAMISYDFKT